MRRSGLVSFLLAVVTTSLLAHSPAQFIRQARGTPAGTRLALQKLPFGQAEPRASSAQASELDFAPAVPYKSGGDHAYSVAVADLNGDGKPDLVVANYCASNM